MKIHCLFGVLLAAVVCGCKPLEDSGNPKVGMSTLAQSSKPEPAKENNTAKAIPKPEDFACVLQFQGIPAPVNLRSHPDAQVFRTELTEQSHKSADFAGFYVAASWGCGSPCQRWALIDLRDGKVYFAPFSTALSARFSIKSRLFIADAPEDIDAYYKDLAGSGVKLEPPEERIFHPGYTTYWEWNESGKTFRQLPHG